ncbi:MAG: LamG domain-containing protein [Ginsengibacter sp.]
MKLFISVSKFMTLALSLVIILVSCQKLAKPALGDYPKDSNPPGGPLKFYAAMDGTSVDSVRANFGIDNSATYTGGISGEAYQGSATSYIKYGKPNDFAKSSSFTIAFWIKKTPQAAGSGTNFAFSLNAKGYSWTNAKLFLEFEDWSTPTLGNCKFYLMDQWIEYTNANGMPNVTNGSWHHLAFTYDGTTSQFVSYIDGVIFKTNTVGTLGPVNFGDIDDFTIGGPNQYTHDQNTWMGFWEGQIDQFRLYNAVLLPADIQALFTNKQ